MARDYGVFQNMNNKRLRRDVYNQYGPQEVNEVEVEESLPEGAPKPTNTAGGN